MSDVLGSGKDFDDLTDEELAELEARDWTEAEILAAFMMALEDGAVGAGAALVARLARKNLQAAQRLVELIELESARRDRA